MPPSQAAESEGSWHSSAPGSPTGLQQKVQKVFDPRKETLGDYTTRLRKQASALEVLGSPLSPGVLDTLLVVAQMGAKLHQEAQNPQEEIRLIKREYAYELIEDDPALDRKVKIMALESMMRDRGLDVQEFKRRIQRGDPLSPERTRPSEGNDGRPVPKATAPRPEGAAPGFVTPPRPRSAGSPEYQELQGRVRDTEIRLAAAELRRPEASLADVLEKQTELLEKSLKPRTQASTIKVEPRIKWPNSWSKNFIA